MSRNNNHKKGNVTDEIMYHTILQSSGQLLWIMMVMLDVIYNGQGTWISGYVMA